MLWAGTWPPSFFLPHVPRRVFPPQGHPTSQDSFIYSAWLEDSISTAEWRQLPRYQQDQPHGYGPPVIAGGQGWARRSQDPFQAPGGRCVMGLPLAVGSVGWPLSLPIMVVGGFRALEVDGALKGKDGSWGWESREGLAGVGGHWCRPPIHAPRLPGASPRPVGVAPLCLPPQAPLQVTPAHCTAKLGDPACPRDQDPAGKHLNIWRPSWYTQLPGALGGARDGLDH